MLELTSTRFPGLWYQLSGRTMFIVHEAGRIQLHPWPAERVASRRTTESTFDFPRLPKMEAGKLVASPLVREVRIASVSWFIFKLNVTSPHQLAPSITSTTRSLKTTTKTACNLSLNPSTSFTARSSQSRHFGKPSIQAILTLAQFELLQKVCSWRVETR